jgi:hypothetical protein
MQQPPSIKKFDIFYLSALAVGTVGFFLGYDDTVAQLRTQMAGTGMEIGDGFVTGSFIVSMAISLLLWWFISSKRSPVAKWILIILTAFSVLGTVMNLQTMLANLTIASGLSLLAVVLSLVAIYFLFPADTKPWFDKEERR